MSISNSQKPSHRSELKLKKILSKIVESNENEEEFISILNENRKSLEIKEEPTSNNPPGNLENSPENSHNPHNSNEKILEEHSPERAKTPKKTSSSPKLKSNFENINNINSKDLTEVNISHARNKTAFNFDFNSGTFETEIIAEPETPSKNKELNYNDLPNDPELNTRKNLRNNHQSTKSEELGQFLYNAFNEDDDNFMDEPSSRDLSGNNNSINYNLNSGNTNRCNNDSISFKSYDSPQSKKRSASVEMDISNIPYNINTNFNLSSENDNDNEKDDLDSFNITKTDTKIDLIYYLNKKMDKKDFPKIPDYSTKLKNEINEKNEFEYISVEYKNDISNLIKKQYKSIKTNLLILVKEKETYLISSDDNGKLIVFSIEKDKLLFDVPNCYENDKVMANRNSKIKAMDHSHNILICGYSNGYVVLYKTNNLPLSLKKFREYKNITKESIADIKIFIKNQKSLIFYLSDVSGCIYKSKIKQGMIKDKFEHYLLCKNENKLTYYNIQIFYKYHNIIAIANQKEIEILKVYSHKNSNELNTGNSSNSSSSLKTNENRLKCFTLFKLKYEDYNIKSFSYLPSFLFGIESDNFYISLENVIYVYKFVYLTNNEENINIKTLSNNDIKVQIISSISFDEPLMTIGAFGTNLIYVIDSRLQVSFINYSYNLNFNNIVKIKNEINLFEPKNIYDEEKKIFISTFNNSIISANHNNTRLDIDQGLIYFYGIEDIAVLKNISFKEEIDKLAKKYENSKLNYFFILFQTIIDIYKDKHPIFKKKHIFRFDIMINNIFNCFIFYFFNHCYNEKNNDLIYLEIFFYFLFEINHINYIVNECFGNFESNHRLEIYYKILEIYILNNKLVQDKNYPIKFYLKLIDIYSTNNKKQFLSKLLLHLDKEIIYKNKEILEALNNNNIITTLMSIYSYNNNIYSKFNARASSLRSTIRTDVEYYDYFKPIEYIIDKIFYYNEKSENYKNKNESNLINNIFLCQKENIDLYNDNLFYNINYFKLIFIFYLYELIDKFGIEVISENDDYCLGILTSNEIFTIYNNNSKDTLKSNLIDEYFYLIKRIIDYWKDKELNENIKDLVNTINNKINNLKFHYDELKDKVLLNFYELVIKISAKNEECKFSKILLIKSILFLLNNNSNTRNSGNSNSNFYGIIENLSGTDNLEGDEDMGSIIFNEERGSSIVNIQNQGNDLENDIIDILKNMDCITNNDYNSLVSACGNTSFYKVKDYVLKNKI